MVKRLTNKSGFSLVEILVAAAVVGLTLFSVVAIVRKGQESIALDQHRRMARSIVDSRLESPRYTSDAFNSLTPVSLPAETVKIDSVTNLNGYLSLTIRNDSVAGTGGIAWIPYREVTMLLYWPEDGKNDTVLIRRLVAK